MPTEQKLIPITDDERRGAAERLRWLADQIEQRAEIHAELTVEPEIVDLVSVRQVTPVAARHLGNVHEIRIAMPPRPLAVPGLP